MNIFKASYLIFSILFLFQNPAISFRAESIVAADLVEGVKTSKNYLKAKSHFEKTANGWSGYDDGAATRPVNGTGGTVTTTCTRTTSSPLSGVGSLIMTKGAADYQGEGCSVDFTVDEKDQAKVLQVEFDYIVSSGTFTAGTSSTDSDVIVYLYDVTNSVLIEPSTFKLYSSSTTISDKFIGNFQTAYNSKSYRLMFHIASSANTSSMVLKVDDVKVSPSNYVYGTPITDWQSFTPTGTWSTNTTYTGFSRRVGDTEEYEIKIALGGAPTSATLNVNLRSGRTIDTAKMTYPTADRTVLGTASILDSGTANIVGFVAYNNTTSVLVQPWTLDTLTTGAVRQVGAATQASPITFANGDTIQLKFSVPITGWSSSVQQSDGYDGRLIAVSATRSTSQTLTSGALTTLIFNTVATGADTTSSYNSTTGIFTVPSSGIYSVDFSARDGSTGGALALAEVLAGGISYRVFQSAAHPTNDSFSGAWQGPLVAGNTIQVKYRNDGATSAIGTFANLNIKKLSSPTTISATETVAANYNTASGTLSAAWNLVTFTNKVKDTNGSYSSGVYTVSQSGDYNIMAQTVQSASLTSSGYALTAIFVDGTAIAESGVRAEATTTGLFYAPVQIMSYPLRAGQTVEIKTYNNDATATFASGVRYNYFGIQKIK